MQNKLRYNISGTVYLSGSTLSVISSAGTITINNFSNGQLGISLNEKETIDKKNVERDVFLQEDFCSPLILYITKLSSNNTFKQNIFTYAFKSDIINNYFYLFERKGA